ncbi:MAG: hypothetical protein A2731_03635 [Candidatus Buchananbacteria bacterium RIFCSPHIGHO2_01_FULL_39_8]|uniref:Glutamyl-tRNA amidotransferase n=1 Tax=Candidatus Buchananbacteria bacterium RIFCSPHIGHO2_01_FULL_39_8 TaxID=1797533 RepID=A0A1G1XZS6_9BACT|nr:MAG: hypothetical protein A2731_03635 [Candidatus Buchananbacteria bacterium RIFCSPHIGHO2_01_FULL_39_8]
MTVLEQIEKDFIQAFKAKNELAVLTLRQLKTALTNAEIAKKREPLTEEEVIKTLKTEVKRRREAIELYKKGGRNELAQREEKEIEIISKYLPVELSEEAVKKTVQAVISKVGASGPQDIGKVMGAVMAELKGQADGSLVSKIVKEELTPKK